MSFARIYRNSGWFGFVRSTLLLAVVLCWVDRGFGSWVLLGVFCLVRVTTPPRKAETQQNKEQLQPTHTTVDRHHSQIKHRSPPQNQTSSQAA